MCVFFSKAWGIRHRFSEHVMANISHVFYFYLLCNHCHTHAHQIRTKTVSKRCLFKENRSPEGGGGYSHFFRHT